MAKQAGVSEATVSRVLNGKPGISDATRAAVLTALDVIGYERPTHLRVRRARMVGLVVPELQNPIFPALAEVVGGALAQRGLQRGALHPDREHVRGGVRRDAPRAAGLGHGVRRRPVRRGRRAARALSRLLKLRLPVVLVNAAAEHLDFPRVSTDDAVAMEQAYGHLASLGHERIGLILGPPDHVPSRRKLAAFEAACSTSDGKRARGRARRAHDVLPRGRPRRRHPADQAGRDRDRLRERPDGARRDPRGAPRAGSSVPADISVVGYDDSAFMSCTDPPLTTVRQPIEAIGRAAVAMLAGQIEGAAVSAEELFFEPEIVARGSTAAAPVKSCV